MNLKVFPIDQKSLYFEQAIALGEANRATLGFFPKGAFEESASKKRIIVAVDEDSRSLLGYLLYGISRRKMLAYIVHLCVAGNQREKGIARALFNELDNSTKSFRAIRVHCRIDYEANNLWPKLGFSAVNEIPGRSKDGSTTLRVWWFDHNYPSLFTFAEQQNQKAKVAIDANVFFELRDPEMAGNEESLALLEPWLEIDLCLTPEIYNEIARNPNKTVRDKSRKFADLFKISPNLPDKFQSAEQELNLLLPPAKSVSDESDRRQLARAISADIPFFVTRDGFLLDNSDEVLDKFGIQILQPSDLILLQDELLRGAEYSPSRLSGSHVFTERVHSQQSSTLISKFLAYQDETKKGLNKKLQLILSNPTSHDVFVVRGGQEELGLIAYSRLIDNELVIPVFRVGETSVCQIIARHLADSAVLLSSSENRMITRVTDDYLPEFVSDALQKSGFFRIQNEWIKVNIPGVLSKKNIVEKLSSKDFPVPLYEPFEKIVSVLNNIEQCNIDILLDIEDVLWPLKIEDADVPAFIVPIKPEWAMHLFDAQIAGQDLFGGDPTLILNAENVYYRSAVPKILLSPSRLLWYVSSGDNRYQGSMCIKASSYIDEISIGKPKALFSKYKKLGVYKWKDVYNGVAKGDLEKDIRAFKFSKTEVFNVPVPYSRLQGIWKSCGQNFNIVSPISITRSRFFEIYTMGMKGQ